MPTARELLEQADALMRRNRSLVNDDIPVLTEAVPDVQEAQVLRGRGAQARANESAPDIAHDDEGDSIPTLTERVETAPVDVSAQEEGEPSDWLQADAGEPSVTGDVPDSVLQVPADDDEPELGDHEPELDHESEVSEHESEVSEHEPELSEHEPEVSEHEPELDHAQATMRADATVFDAAVAPAALRTRSRGNMAGELVPATEDIEILAPLSTGAEDVFDEEFSRAARMVEEGAETTDAPLVHDEPHSHDEPIANPEMAALASTIDETGAFEHWRAFEDAAPGAVDADAFLPSTAETFASVSTESAASEALAASDAGAPWNEEAQLPLTQAGAMPPPDAPATAMPLPSAEAGLPALNEALEDGGIDLPPPAAMPVESFIPAGVPVMAVGVPVMAAAASVVAAGTPSPSAHDPVPIARDDALWEGIAEEIRMQVLQRIDIFTDTGLREQLSLRLQPIVDRASADLVATINQHVGELLRSYVAEAIEREIESWRRSH